VNPLQAHHLMSIILLHYHGGPETANWPEILQQKPISTHNA